MGTKSERAGKRSGGFGRDHVTHTEQCTVYILQPGYFQKPEVEEVFRTFT